MSPLIDRSPAALTRRSSRACSLPPIRSCPAAFSTNAPRLAVTCPSRLTPTPASVPISRIFPAYMPPSRERSSANAGAVPDDAWRSQISNDAASMSFRPAMTSNCCACTAALTSTARASRAACSRLPAFRPAPVMRRWPSVTRKASREPLPPNTGMPVVRTPRDVLTKPQPSQVRPLGLLIMTSARRPATSR
ncbi:hypothetical protein PFI31113_03637 [Pandoraea fibrosis]|uniref:Uncharacterized protein n=1 Tax=Pandoraea fibrosis TaxID=1891094 RepID=A0A5E4X5M0_9BURK|nr:hypothetical protein PFI31113_03637 [Pandoraea fibrosis]